MNHDRLKAAIRRGRRAADKSWAGYDDKGIQQVPFASVPVATLNLLLKAASKELQRT